MDQFKPLGEEGLKEFRNKVKFGDVVVNHWASEGNPEKTGVFVKFRSVGGQNCIECTDMKGNFWTPVLSDRSKLEIKENVLKD